jgi:hypothetical protein
MVIRISLGSFSAVIDDTELFRGRNPLGRDFDPDRDRLWERALRLYKECSCCDPYDDRDVVDDEQ